MALSSDFNEIRHSLQKIHISIKNSSGYYSVYFKQCCNKAVETSLYTQFTQQVMSQVAIHCKCTYHSVCNLFPQKRKYAVWAIKRQITRRAAKLKQTIHKKNTDSRLHECSKSKLSLVILSKISSSKYAYLAYVWYWILMQIFINCFNFI